MTLKPYIPLSNICPNYRCVYISFSEERVVIKLGGGSKSERDLEKQASLWDILKREGGILMLPSPKGDQPTAPFLGSARSRAFQSWWPSCRGGPEELSSAPTYLHPKKQSEDSACLCKMSSALQLPVCIFARQTVIKPRSCSKHFEQHRREDLKVDQGLTLCSLEANYLKERKNSQEG